MQVKSDPVRSPDGLIDDLARLLEETPALLEQATLWPSLSSMLRVDRDLVQRLRPLLEAHAPGLLEVIEPVTTTATVLPSDENQETV